jgi:hypothetical protein
MTDSNDKIHDNLRDCVLTSTRRVMRQARCVAIERNRIAELAERIPRSLRNSQVWNSERHFADGTPRTAQWVFVLDALNFSFWPAPGNQPWQIDWGGERLGGYWSLACGLNAAMRSGVPITDAGFLEAMDASTLEHLLDGSGPIPMLEERVRILCETGSVLRERYDGEFVNLLAEARYSADAAAALVIRDFPSFRDTANYRGCVVHFFKRPQILMADLHGAFGGKGFGRFDDLDNLTAFADYRLPQVLRDTGILEYSPELAFVVDTQKEILAGSPEEIEIRAATVCAVEELRAAAAAAGNDVDACTLDWWLWDLSHAPGWSHRPHHRTRTIFY